MVYAYCIIPQVCLLLRCCLHQERVKQNKYLQTNYRTLETPYQDNLFTYGELSPIKELL